MESFRFIHTGDIHLDSPLKGLSGQQGAAAERIRTATRVAFDNLISQAIEEQIAFIVIAGDLYDGDWRDYQTGLFFVRQMGRLAQAGTPVFLLYGNHDAESQITRRLILPANVHVFSSRRPATFLLEGYAVALHGQSFRQRDITENLVPAYPLPTAGCFNIGILHTGLGGMGGHLNYAPCAIEDLVNKGYDYWALAHVHQAAILHERPHVAFCGNLQGRHIRESGPKGASLVSVQDGEVDEISPLNVDVVRWTHLLVPADQCETAADAVDLVRQAIEDAVRHESQGRLLACRIELTGRTALNGELLASADYLLAEARAAALGLGEEAAWIERLVITTDSLEATALRQDALGDLQRMIRNAGSDAGLRAQLASDLGDLIRKLPHDVRADAEDAGLKAAIGGRHRELDRACRRLSRRAAFSGEVIAMRIRQLNLLRYGHFTDASITLPASTPDFHGVLGENEAGKSTAMAAIEDLLFGIPSNSPLNFLHEYGAMRVSATLEKGADALTLRRRKGNKDTLLSEQDMPIASGEAALAPYLAGADRRFYTRMFSLDHERLRQGGKEILQAQGDVGQMLFSSSAGIMGLRETMKRWKRRPTHCGPRAARRIESISRRRSD